VHHTTNAQLQQVRNTYKIYETLTQCKQGMYAGGNSHSASKDFCLCVG